MSYHATERPKRLAKYRCPPWQALRPRRWIALAPGSFVSLLPPQALQETRDECNWLQTQVEAIEAERESEREGAEEEQKRLQELFAHHHTLSTARTFSGAPPPHSPLRPAPLYRAPP